MVTKKTSPKITAKKAAIKKQTKSSAKKKSAPKKVVKKQLLTKKNKVAIPAKTFTAKNDKPLKLAHGNIQPHVTFSFVRLLLLLVNSVGVIIFITLLTLYVYLGVYYSQETEKIDEEQVYLVEVSDLDQKRTYQDNVLVLQETYQGILFGDYTSGFFTQTENEFYLAKQSSVTDLLEALYELKVPTSWKDLHINLFSAYSMLAQANSNYLDYLADDEDIEALTSYQNYKAEAEKIFVELQETYSWVASY